jgi:hypothetical protein
MKMGNQDYHAVLGVAKDADPEVIKAAYGALAKKVPSRLPRRIRRAILRNKPRLGSSVEIRGSSFHILRHSTQNAMRGNQEGARSDGLQ